LKAGEVLVVADFSENYSFVTQDSVQGVHSKNKQATVHHFACYARSSQNESVQPVNVVIISDSLEHSTSTVFAFQENKALNTRTAIGTFLSHRVKKMFIIF